jgi:ABC-type nitrate/sulfonate/bicarbonate transport system permease component
MVIWFGIGREFVIASVVIASFILLTFSTAAGVREAMSQYSEVASALKLTGWKMFSKTILPGSVPFIATGMRLAVQRALVAVIVAEYLIGVSGLGFVIRLARVSRNADRLFAMAILLMMVGVALVEVTKYVEKRLSSWRPQAF